MGAWIEIFKASVSSLPLVQSHPTMGAWIEIGYDDGSEAVRNCRTPRWVRGLK